MTGYFPAFVGSTIAEAGMAGMVPLLGAGGRFRKPCGELMLEGQGIVRAGVPKEGFRVITFT